MLLLTIAPFTSHMVLLTLFLETILDVSPSVSGWRAVCPSLPLANPFNGFHPLINGLPAFVCADPSHLDVCPPKNTVIPRRGEALRIVVALDPGRQRRPTRLRQILGAPNSIRAVQSIAIKLSQPCSSIDAPSPGKKGRCEPVAVGCCFHGLAAER